MRSAPVAAIASTDFLVRRSYRFALVYDLLWGVIDLILYYFISRVVGPVSESDLHGAPSYFAFALAGILVSLVIASAASAIGERVREEEMAGTLEALCTQPVSPTELAAGWAGFPIAYAAGRVAVYLVIAVVGLGLSISSVQWGGVLIMLIAASVAFLPLGVLAAAATVVFKRGQNLVGVVIFAMTFVGGALVPLSVMPDWLQAIGKVVPTGFAFNGMRGALFGGSWAPDAALLIGVGAVFIPISLRLFAKALDRAKREGSLAQY
jgi:ABC-2 type transport system permease protein